MSTIDELALASSASDSDEFIVSQAGIARKITRAQVLNGVQSQLAVPSGSLLGNSGSGIGMPEVITVGRNLNFDGSTLSATAAPFIISALPNGTVPSSGDLVSMSQAGTSVAVTYGQLVNGIAGIPNINLTQALVTPTGATTVQTLGQLTAAMLPLSGGTLTGGLTLSGTPAGSMQAASKGYVDEQFAAALPLVGGSLLGMLTLCGTPQYPLQAATKDYADLIGASALSSTGGSLSGSLLLNADPTMPLQASTKHYADLKLARTGDTLAGALVLAADPVSTLQAATKNYVDNLIATTLQKSGGTLLGSLYLASDPTNNAQATTKQYADQKVLRAGDTLAGALFLAADPVLAAQAATKNYVDRQVSVGIARSGSSMTGALLLASDPSVPLQASTKQYVDLRVSRTGNSLTGALYLAANPSAPLQAATKQYVDGQLIAGLPNSGGTLTGPLTLAGVPMTPLQAATKSYVDANPSSAGIINVKLPPYNAKIDGVTDDTAAFKSAYQNATAGGTIYVPSGTTVLQQPGAWGIALTKRVRWIVAGTVLPDGTPLAAAIPTGGGPSTLTLPGFVAGNTLSGLTTSQGSSQSTDFAVNQSSYIVNHSGGTNGTVISNARVDTIIYSSPGDCVWGGLDRLIWAGTQTPTAATPAQHVGRYIQTVRQASTIGSNGSYLPQPQLWGACIEYRDATGQPSSATNASLTIEMDWFGNGLDDTDSRTIQSLVIGQNNTSGPAVEVGTIVGVYLSEGSSGSAKTVLTVGVPFSNAILDSSNAQELNSAPVIKMSAGQAIAFEATNTNRLLFDNITNTLRWNQGSLSYAVGKGITVGWMNIYFRSATLPSDVSGNIIFLAGTTAYTITLPPARTVAAGTGYTFSVTGVGSVSILPSGADGLDSGPITLHINDRYHIVSDGSSFWHEIFWGNAVSPRFLGPIVLPSYAVANLPTGVVAGAKVFASNGRKPNETAGAGSGVDVFFDGQRWISSCSGSPVAS